MKKIYFVTFLLAICTSLFAQPSFVKGDFGSGWSDYQLIDRGVVKAVTINATVTNASNNFLFTQDLSFIPKWCGSTSDYTRNLNQYLSGAAYYYPSGTWDHDLVINITNGKYYTFITEKNTTANNSISILETNFNPVIIGTVSQNPASPAQYDSVSVTATLSGTKATEEKIFLRYSSDNWLSSHYIEYNSFNGSFQGTVKIPPMATGTNVSYYLLSTIISDPTTVNIDYFSLNINNNAILNYQYTTVLGSTPAMNITASPALNEATLNNANISIELLNTTFVDNTPLLSSFTLYNQPAGLSIDSVYYIDPTHVNINLAFNGTDFDADSTHFFVSIDGIELFSANNLNSIELTITAVIEVINQGINYGNIVLDRGNGAEYLKDIADFNGINLGSFNPSSTFILKSAQMFVWKNTSGNITECSMYYRIYKTGSTAGSFAQMVLPWNANLSSTPPYTDQLWWNNAANEINLNILTGLSNGNYKIEVYFEALNGVETMFRNNGGANYIASFDVTGGYTGCPFTVSLGNDTNICGMLPLTLSPGVSISPYGDTLVITYDATQGQSQLAGAAKVYMFSAAELHTNGGWQYTKGSNDLDDNIGLMTSLGNNRWRIKICPVTYFGYPVDSVLNGVLMVFRNADGTAWGHDATGSDIWVNMNTTPPVSSFAGVTTQYYLNPIDSIVWSDNSHGETLTVSTTNNYWVKVINKIGGCSATDTIHIGLASIPDINLGADKIICLGSSVALNAGSGYAGYLWSTAQTTSGILISSAGTYSVTATNALGCTGFDVINISTVEPPIANFTVTVNHKAATFTDMSQRAVTYWWDFNGNGTPESTSAGTQTYNYPQAGQFVVKMKVGNACKSDSISKQIIVTGINEIDFISKLELYPNPARDKLSLNFISEKATSFEISIENILGQNLYKQSYKSASGSFSESIDISEFAQGSYILSILSEGKRIKKLIVKN